MAAIKHFDHVGITVADLDAALDFFVSLGMELEGRTFMEGEFLDTVCGIPNSRTEVAMLRLPGGGTTIEICTFVRPELERGTPNAMSTEIGLRNVAFEVEDLHAMVERVRADGYELVGGIGEWENAWRMTYVRGPEGIIVALAERLG
ncbi:VOC family protein [Janibacter sp. HTCC2649]|uniref:VOC family protein n=1 Tax=Janibacter sp. HTCC2649 TaxID=313589 RepID=UPI000593C7D9|nr:VOC family protein [Janibacter sp. HTCC2649]